jgi:hypothetical protein
VSCLDMFTLAAIVICWAFALHSVYMHYRPRAYEYNGWLYCAVVQVALGAINIPLLLN